MPLIKMCTLTYTWPKKYQTISKFNHDKHNKPNYVFLTFQTKATLATSRVTLGAGKIKQSRCWGRIMPSQHVPLPYEDRRGVQEGGKNK